MVSHGITRMSAYTECSFVLQLKDLPRTWMYIMFPRGSFYPPAVGFAPPAITRRIYRIQSTDIGSFARLSIILGDWSLPISTPTRNTRDIWTKKNIKSQSTLVKIQRRVYIHISQHLSHLIVIFIFFFGFELKIRNMMRHQRHWMPYWFSD